ncbi:molybdopterin biosynthesis protein A [Methanocella arvoryzae MRE50]|uniref:Molybdopterin biosynthesis protein A n=2 Tax=Methanocella TaxID=570266 RepID=Q0W415_METAR|nr:molybdopterin biosynthesis protein A [Methanocella arvoryzae MRE50]
MTGDFERMVPLQRALELIGLMRDRLYRALGTEAVDTTMSAGRHLAADAIARATSPPCDICTMDGYAIASLDSYPLRIVRAAYAGEAQASIKPGEAAYVTTGAKLPAGAQAVMKAEDARIEGHLLYGPRIEPGTFVLRQGADFKEGEVLIPAGTVITPSMVGVLQAAAIPSVRVYRPVSVAVITTGDEIASGDIRDTNGPMICALLRSWGCIPGLTGAVRDDPDLVRETIKAAAASHDLVITVGGVSAGAKDYVRKVAEEGEILFRGVRMKPGMPFTAGYYAGKPLLSLPGKPAGSYAGMEMFVRRLVHEARDSPTVSMPLSSDVSFGATGFDYVVFVELKDGCARPMGYNGSSLGLFKGTEYMTSLISAASKSLLSQGYILARNDLHAGECVDVNLL